MEYNYFYTTSTEQPTQQDDSKSVTDQLEFIKKQKLELQQQEGEILGKAFNSNDTDTLIKASSHWQDVKQRHSSEIKTDLVDPNKWSDSSGYKSKLFSLSYNTLRRMAKTPVIKAIITTRQTQVSSFSSPQKNRYETGFVITKKREYYTEEEPKVTSQDKQKIKQLTEFILNGGQHDNAWHGDTFDSFLKKITADSLTIDQACFEVVRNRAGSPTEYLAVDGATFRIADSYDDDAYEKSGDHSKQKMHGYYPSYVQILEGTIKNEYFPWELCFGVRNTATDIMSNGYGTSEVEELVNIITWMLFADSYNGKFFSQGSSPKGIIKLQNGVNRNRLQQFRQEWISMVSGVQNAWKVPILESDKMEYIDLQKNNTDMQFSQWQEYLIKISCAMFKIAPEEVGFNLGNANGNSALFEGGNEAKLKYSRDKGLKPLLNSIEFWINKWIIQPIDPNFEFKFAGIDIDSEEKEVELDIKKVGSFMGYKEARKKHNLPEELDEGDFILNPQFTQMLQSQMMSEQQEQSTEFVDDQDTDDQFALWDELDQDVTKSLGQYANNPMMQDAVNTLLKDSKDERSTTNTNKE